MLIGCGSEQTSLSDAQLREQLYAVLSEFTDRRKVIAVPPDITRFHSSAGRLTELAYEFLGPRLEAVVPATGTHTPMSPAEIRAMYAAVPERLFRQHDWLHNMVKLGEVPPEFIHQQSKGRLDYSWPVHVNRTLVEGWDLILSIGQVVPHEVVGMANQNKNILIGMGGADTIHRSHFLGAVVGIEQIMGRADTPVRRVLNYAAEQFCKKLPILYVLTVRAKDAEGKIVTRGLYIGDDNECFERAAALSLKVNFEMVPAPFRKAVVHLNPAEFKSTWLGNKAIYRTRMAMADEGELIVVAPGVKAFGEAQEIDRLIRRYGYLNTPQVLDAVRRDPELAANLGAAAHLIHGSSEGRFRITYCTSHLSKEEIEGAQYSFMPVDAALTKYDPAKLRDGYQTVCGEEIFYISNPGLGLWAHPSRFEGKS
jgi:nickel-dependent lactate racemase